MKLDTARIKQIKLKSKIEKLERELARENANLVQINKIIENLEVFDKSDKDCEITGYNFKNNSDKIFREELLKLYPYEEECRKAKKDYLYTNIHTRSFKCRLCDRIYQEGSDDIDKHIAFLSKVCKNKTMLLNSQYLSDHYPDCRCDKLSRCDICDESGEQYKPFKTRAARSIHMKRHKKEKEGKATIEEPSCVETFVPPTGGSIASKDEPKVPQKTEKDWEREEKERMEQYDKKREKWDKEEQELKDKQKEKERLRNKEYNSYEYLIDAYQDDIKIAELRNKIFCVFCQDFKEIKEACFVRENQICCKKCRKTGEFINPYDSNSEDEEWYSDSESEDNAIQQEQFSLETRPTYLT
jgi:hypothetical protein